MSIEYLGVLMFPHEMQAVMAKVLFFVFATLILCLSKVRAVEMPLPLSSSVEIVQTL
jgi:hypothetical protein